MRICWKCNDDNMEKKQKTINYAFRLIVHFLLQFSCFTFFVKKYFCVAKPRNHFAFCEVWSDNLYPVVFSHFREKPEQCSGYFIIDFQQKGWTILNMFQIVREWLFGGWYRYSYATGLFSGWYRYSYRIIPQFATCSHNILIVVNSDKYF